LPKIVESSTGDAAPKEEMPVLAETQGREGLCHAHLQFYLLGLPVPNTHEGFPDLLGQDLLRVLVVDMVRLNWFLSAVLVKHGCGFGVEHEELFVFVGG
jgi:hypothetical protein